jgi:hypothetical protein
MLAKQHPTRQNSGVVVCEIRPLAKHLASQREHWRHDRCLQQGSPTPSSRDRQRRCGWRRHHDSNKAARRLQVGTPGGALRPPCRAVLSNKAARRLQVGTGPCGVRIVTLTASNKAARRLQVGTMNGSRLSHLCEVASDKAARCLQIATHSVSASSIPRTGSRCSAPTRQPDAFKLGLVSLDVELQNRHATPTRQPDAFKLGRPRGLLKRLRQGSAMPSNRDADATLGPCPPWGSPTRQLDAFKLGPYGQQTRAQS